MPIMFGVGALGAAVLTVALDNQFDFQVHDSRFLVSDAGTALTLTSVVATGMLAFLGLVFATTLVAIQLAGSQYSPRVVRVFIRSRLTKVSLGIFVATLVYSIVTLIAIRAVGHRARGFTPVLSTAGVALLVMATVVAFLVFANGTARLLRVQYLVERIADETRPALLGAFPTEAGDVGVESPPGSAASTIIVSRVHGVIDAVDVRALAGLAIDVGGWIETTVPIGSYVATGAAIATVHGDVAEASRDSVAQRVAGSLLVTNERTLLQDPGFGIRQLVDIAIRALSPAVNDPTTAVQVLDRITELLIGVVDRPDPTGWHVDGSGAARVRIPPETFGALMTLGFAEIIRFGADSPQVIRRVRASLDTLAARSSRERRDEIDRVRSLLEDATVEHLPRSFRALAAIPDPRGLG